MRYMIVKKKSCACIQVSPHFALLVALLVSSFFFYSARLFARDKLEDIINNLYTHEFYI